MALRLRVQLPQKDGTPGGAIEEVILPENGPTSTVEGYKAALEPYGYKVLEVVGTAAGPTVEVISQDQLIRQGYLGPNQVLDKLAPVDTASNCDMGVCGPTSSGSTTNTPSGGNLPGQTPGTIPRNDDGGQFQFKGGGPGGLLASLFPVDESSKSRVPANQLPTGSGAEVMTLGYDWWRFVKGPFGILLAILIVLLLLLQTGKSAVVVPQ